MGIRTRTILASVVAGFVVFGYTGYANAGIWFGQSSSEESVLVTNAITLALGQIEGNIAGAYITVDNNGNSGYFIYKLMRCPTKYQTSCDTKYATTTVGGSTPKSVSMSGYNSKSTIYLDMEVLNQNFACSGSGCNGVSGGHDAVDDYWWYVYVEGTSSATSFLNDKSWHLYGTSVETYDRFGNRLGCGNNPAGSCGGDVETPFYWIADSPVDYYTGTTYGFATPASASSGFAISGAKPFCQTMAAGIASSSTAFGIPYGLTYAGCFVPGMLLIPSKDSVDFMFAQAGVVKTRVPYVYFDQFRTAWASASNAGTQAFPEVSIPWNVMSASTSLTIVSSASFTRWVSSSTLSGLRSITTVALYVSFGWYVWNRTRKLFRGI